ncbi:MAG: sulfatase, partial [Planctomycetota bacterium]
MPARKRTCLWSALLLLLSAGVGHAAERPNIVFILADDLGWSDVGFNGGKAYKHFYETPHIDRLAAEGMAFTRAYSGGPNCMPTRACLISGMYTPRTQMWTPAARSKGPVDKMKLLVPRRGDKQGDVFPSKESLDPAVVSIAEVLNDAGYATARLGKWHLGPDPQGFGVSDLDGRGATSGKFYGNVNVHEWLTDASCRFIDGHRDEPFFLYLAHWDVHTPLRAREAEKQKFDKKLASGKWDRKWNTTYAAMIKAVDDSVGRIRAKLDELGLTENTLVVFSSDNGGTPVTTMKPLKGAKGSLFEGGVRVPTCMAWPAVIEPGTTCDTPITSVDFMPTFAEHASVALPSDQPVDGTSIVPLFRGEPLAERSIFW